jgi:2-isopropylmalate synthase
LDREALDRVFARFKTLADRKKVVTDSDLVALVTNEVGQPEATYTLVHVNVSCGTGVRTASVGLRGPNDHLQVEAAVGNGPVEAVFRAIDAIVRVDCTLVDYQLHATTEGKNALGEASVKIRGNDEGMAYDHPQHDNSRPRIFHGHGANVDILEASAQAYVSAINKLLATSRLQRVRDDDEPHVPAGDILSEHGVDAGAPPEGQALWDNPTPVGRKRAG